MCAVGAGSIVLGSLAVIVGLTLASYATYFGIRTHNPLWFIQAVGKSGAFVVGVVGQRAYYPALIRSPADANAKRLVSAPRSVGRQCDAAVGVDSPVLYQRYRNLRGGAGFLFDDVF